MRYLCRTILKFLYWTKQRFFPDFTVTHVIPFWNRILHRLVLGAKSKSNFAEDVLGHKMYLDDQDSLQLSIHKIYEPAETRFFSDYVKEGMVVLDVGANIGYYTLQFARKVGDKGHVYAFEPDPQNFKLLMKNAEINGYKNVTLIPKAVSDVTGKIKLYPSAENKGDHRIYQSGDDRQFFSIESTRLDDYLESIKSPVDLIKMDIQGAEYRALVGMQKVLARNPQAALVTEFWPSGLSRSGASSKTFLDLLQAQGLELFEISEAKEGIEKVEPSDLLGKYKEHRDVDMTNLMCRRRPGGQALLQASSGAVAPLRA